MSDPQPVLVFTMTPLTADDIATLDKNYGDVSNSLPADLTKAFSDHSLGLDANVEVSILGAKTQWLLQDGDKYYEMRANTADGLDVYSVTAAMFAVIKTKAATANGVSALNLITSSCHAIQNTQLNPLPEWIKDPKKKPDWFDPLVATLDKAQVLANQWIDTIGPELTAKLPGKIVTYNAAYGAITDQIISIAQANPTARGKDDPNVQNVFELINGLKTEVGTIHDEMLDEDEVLKKWGQDMQAVYKDLSSGVGDIQAAEADLKADIGKMNSAISGLQAKIEGENKAIAAAGIAIGVGVFAMVAGIALAPVTGGASLVVSGIGAAAVIGGAITWGIMQHKIDQQYDEIAADQKRIASDKAQIVALQGLETGTTQAASSTSIATQALSSVRALWLLLAGELEGVIKQLDLANQDLSLIVNEAFVNGAAREWKSAEQLAQTLVNTKMQVESKDVPMDSSQAA